MVEQSLPSDREAAVAPAVLPSSVPAGITQRHRRSWFGSSLVRLAVLVIAGVHRHPVYDPMGPLGRRTATRQVTDDAYVRGDITPLSAQVEGYVRRVAVDDFQRVKKGDLLIEIDDADYQARVAQAEAGFWAPKPRSTTSRRGRRHSTPRWPRRKARSPPPKPMSSAPRPRRRGSATLLATTFGTRQKVEQAIAEEKRFAATLARNQAALDAQRRQLAVLDTAGIAVARRGKAKQAMLDLAKINLGYTRIAAPVDGDGQRARRARRAVRPCRDTGDLGGAARQCLGHRATTRKPSSPMSRSASRRRSASTPSRGSWSTRRVDSIAPASGCAVQPAAAGQRDRQFYQGRAADPGQVADRPTTIRSPADCGRVCRWSRRS